MPETRDFSLRRANQEDIYELMSFSQEFYNNSHLAKYFKFNHRKTGALIEEAIDREDFLVLVMEEGEEIIGGLMAFVSPCFFSDGKQTVCLAWYLKPKHRGLKKSLALVKEYENWAEEQEATLINLINVNMSAPKAFTKLGYEMNEVTFTKENK